MTSHTQWSSLSAGRSFARRADSLCAGCEGCDRDVRVISKPLSLLAEQCHLGLNHRRPGGTVNLQGPDKRGHYLQISLGQFPPLPAPPMRLSPTERESKGSTGDKGQRDRGGEAERTDSSSMEAMCLCVIVASSEQGRH